MKIRLTKIAPFALSAIGLLLLTMVVTGKDQTRQNPCEGSFAIYVDGAFVECLDFANKQQAYARPESKQ